MTCTPAEIAGSRGDSRVGYVPQQLPDLPDRYYFEGNYEMRIRARSFFCGLGKIALAALAMVLMSASAQLAMAQLEVTEVMYNPLDEGEWEWIEVRNTGGSDIDLDGWLGFNLNDTEVTAPNPTILSSPDSPNTMIKAGEVAVIYDGFHGTGQPGTFDDTQFRAAWGLSSTVPLLAASFWPNLSNTEGSLSQSIGFWANETDYLADIAPVEDPGNPGTFVNRTVQFTNAQFNIDYADAAYPAADGMSSMTWTGQGARTNGSTWVLSQSGTAGAVTSVEASVASPSNNIGEVANPRAVTTTGAAPSNNLLISEIMYDSGASTDADWEWIEIHNPGPAAVDISNWVVDDINGVAHTAANIPAGSSVPAGGTAILFNGDDTTETDFATAWGATLNLIPVEDWGAMQLNNSGDTIALWTDFATYSAGAGDHNVHANAELSLTYTDDPDFPDSNNSASITLNDLGADPADGLSWDLSFLGDGLSDNPGPVGDSSVFHAGGDIGSPGTFVVQDLSADVDLDDDGDVDGADFLAIQRTDPSLISAWQSQYGSGGLAATASVPEPSSVVLIGLALTLLPLTRRRHV